MTNERPLAPPRRLRAAAGAPARPAVAGRRVAGRRLVVAALVLLTLVDASPASAVLARYDVTAERVGGAGGDAGRAIAFDDSGNEYLAGSFTGSIVIGDVALDGATASTKGVFLAKYSPTGSVLWARQIAGSKTVELGALSVDASGGVYVTGSFAGDGRFGPAGRVTLSSTGGSVDGFVARYDAGGALVWAKRIGGAVRDTATGVAASGGPVVVGTFGGVATFGDGPARKTLTASGPDQLFVAAFSPTGSLRWVMSASSPTATAPRAVTADRAGQLYVAGAFATTLTVPGTRPPLAVTSAGGRDIFVLAVAATGGARWLQRAGGPATDEASSIDVDPAGTAPTVVGSIAGSATFGVARPPVTISAGARSTAFVARYRPAAGDLAWVRAPDGPGVTAATAVAVDAAGNPVVGGTVDGTARWAGTPDVELASPNRAGFVATLDSGGSATWARTQTSAGGAATLAVSIRRGTIGIAGSFDGTATVHDDFAGVTLPPSTADDAFAARYAPHTNRPPSTPGLAVTAVSAQPTPLVLTGTDPDNDPLTFLVTTPPSSGALTGSGAALTYQSRAGFTGVDSFAYVVRDPYGGEARGAATITVLSPSSPPVANDLTVATIGGRSTPVTVSAQDPAGSPLTYRLSPPIAAHGTVTGTGPSYTYTATPGYVGPDAFGYTVTTTRGTSASAQVHLNVKRPNIVMILTDDQTLGQQAYLPKTNAIFGAEGTSFSDYVVSYSECCPSRATLLTGQYSHNNGMISSMLPTGGSSKFDDRNSLATWLQAAGYYTSLSGKYFNGYGVDQPATYVPRGWSDWFALNDPTAYEQFDYDVSVNGTLRHYGSAEADYGTDVLRDHAEDVIRSKAGTASPFFVYVAPTAPHNVDGGLATVAPPRYQDTLGDVQIPRTPSFNQADVSSMPSWIRDLPPLSPQTIAGLDNIYRIGAEAMLGIDDLVEGIYQTLQATGELDNTLLVLSSDNGFDYGDHRIMLGKADEFDSTVHLPLLVRGPGFPAGKTVTQPVANIDLAPTFTATAGVTAGRTMDGVPLNRFATDPTYGTMRTILIENGELEGRRTYQGVRNHRFSYVESDSGETEVYDLAVDPFQTRNLIADPDAFLAIWGGAVRLAQAKSCAGISCHIGIP